MLSPSSGASSSPRLVRRPRADLVLPLQLCPTSSRHALRRCPTSRPAYAPPRRLAAPSPPRPRSSLHDVARQPLLTLGSLARISLDGSDAVETHRSSYAGRLAARRACCDLARPSSSRARQLSFAAPSLAPRASSGKLDALLCCSVSAGQPAVASSRASENQPKVIGLGVAAAGARWLRTERGRRSSRLASEAWPYQGGAQRPGVDARRRLLIPLSLLPAPRPAPPSPISTFHSRTPHRRRSRCSPRRSSPSPSPVRPSTSRRFPRTAVRPLSRSPLRSLPSRASS